MRLIKLCILSLIALLLVSALLIYINFGGGSDNFPDRSGTPTQDWNEVELVANLDTPPGNIAVTPNTSCHQRKMYLPNV